MTSPSSVFTHSSHKMPSSSSRQTPIHRRQQAVEPEASSSSSRFSSRASTAESAVASGSANNCIVSRPTTSRSAACPVADARKGCKKHTTADNRRAARIISEGIFQKDTQKTKIAQVPLRKRRHRLRVSASCRRRSAGRKGSAAPPSRGRCFPRRNPCGSRGSHAVCGPAPRASG